jgi:hypothetical protein
MRLHATGISTLSNVYQSRTPRILSRFQIFCTVVNHLLAGHEILSTFENGLHFRGDQPKSMIYQQCDPNSQQHQRNASLNHPNMVALTGMCWEHWVSQVTLTEMHALCEHIGVGALVMIQGHAHLHQKLQIWHVTLS